MAYTVLNGGGAVGGAAGFWSVNASGNLVPLDGTRNIGTASARVANVFCDEAGWCSDDATKGSTQFASGTVSLAIQNSFAYIADTNGFSPPDNTKTLGVDGARWKGIYGLFDQVISGQGTTSGAATTTVATFTPPDERGGHFWVYVAGRKSDGTQVGGYIRRGVWKRDGGTTSVLTATETIGTDREDDAGWNFAVTVASPAINFDCTGAAGDDIAWTVRGFATIAGT